MISKVTQQFLKDSVPEFYKIVKEFNLSGSTCQNTELIYPLGLSIRNYTLLPILIISLIVGAYKCFTKREENRQLWFSLYFSSFSACSILFYNILPRYDENWYYARMLQLVFMGSTNICFVMNSTNDIINLSTFYVLLGIVYYGDYTSKSIPFISEILSIGTMLLSYISLLRKRVKDTRVLIGVFCIFIALPLDNLLCRVFGSMVGGIHLMRVGFLLTFVGLTAQGKVKTE
jgi:hypothetical protein